MPFLKPKRRWLQFSLRSVLLLTLAVALWLGYEVRQVRNVERTIAAIRALGGDASCEPTGGSLLRCCRVPGYGQRIVRAEIPGTAVEEGISLLHDLCDRCAVEVTYDGTFDPTPSWYRVNQALGASVRARAINFHAGEESERFANREDWERFPRVRMLTRLRARMLDAYAQTGMFWPEPNMFSTYFQEFRYELLVLPDGTLAELLMREGLFMIPGGQRSFVALITEDRCAVKTLGPVDARVFQLSADPRDWLGVYRITRDGFKSLLPEDKSDFP